MVIIKRMDSFVLQRFLPVLAMTFFICLFIVMMQFLWRFIEDLVGKGLSFGVIAELFWYATLTMVPTALPLAVLLASLMTFGNLGEKFELTAMKSAGISLMRIMAPLIILMSLMAVGAFFFQNNVLPMAQTKMWTLVFSIRQKSPEVEIPVRSFYSAIPNMNLYIDGKNPDTGMLYDMIIYDTSRGMDNSRIILADSGKISFTKDKNFLFLKLNHGELFENFTETPVGVQAARNMPFRRESFKEKQVYIAFDANFNRIDEEGMRSQYIGKNISELSRGVDSIQAIVDSIGYEYGMELKTAPSLSAPYYVQKYVNGEVVTVPAPQVHPVRQIDVDSVFNNPSPVMAKSYINQALMQVQRRHNEFDYKTLILNDQAKIMRRHDIEMEKKFTLSFACLIFFFIGAPLGAIIKKGGLGTPLVISVLLFVVYFIFDNIGMKMARDGKVAVWEGVWLSSMVLLPMGVFFTYKAVGDSSMLDGEVFMRPIRKLLMLAPKRNVKLKEVVLDPPAIPVLRQYVADFDNVLVQRMSDLKIMPFYRRVFARMGNKATQEKFDDMVYDLSFSLDPYINRFLNRYPTFIYRKNIKTIRTINAELIKYLDTQMLIDETKKYDSTGNPS